MGLEILQVVRAYQLHLVCNLLHTRIRSTGEVPVPMTDVPQTAVQDRHYLCLEIAEYRNFAEALSNHCYLNREGQHCKLKNAKTKKLKNLRYGILKSDYLLKSLIWKEQLRLIEAELQKRRGVPRYAKP